ncbi:MAG: glycosyltransferase family 87 protein [Candidatus Sulfotelmatobacter sp.]
MPSSRDASESNPRIVWDWSSVLCLALILAAGVEFVVRGPIRAVQSSTQFNDFLCPYIQADAWTRGLDPYGPQTLLRLWPAQAAHLQFVPREVADGSIIAKRGIPTAYPISSLVLIASLAWLPWNLAYGLWFAINLALFGIMLSVLVELAGFSYRDIRGGLLIALVLALAPFHTGFVTGNVALAAVELGVIAVWTARQRYDLTTALLLALSAGLKPQIGLCFLLYYLVRRCWRIFAGAAALLALFAAVGVLRLEVSHTPWVGNYLNDNHVLLESGILANFTPVNPMRFGLLNVQVILYSLVGNVSVANRAAELIGATFLAAWLIVVWKRNSQDKFDLLDLSAIVVASLLPVYHRFYDAVLLVLPLCWVFASYRKARVFGILTLLLMAPFLIPGGTILQTMQTNGRIPSSLSGRWWWNTIVMPHEIWALFFLSLLLLYEMALQGNFGNEHRVAL